MADDEFSPAEEEEPPSLKKKWEQESSWPAGVDECPHCGEEVPADSFFCLFCGERIRERAGTLSGMAYWLKKGFWIWALAAIVLIFFGVWFL